MSIWRELGIRRTRDRLAIARAYAARLEEFDPETEPARAGALCAAYEQAHRFCDALDSGPLPRIAPRHGVKGRDFSAQEGTKRPCRYTRARAQEVARAVDEFTCMITGPLRRGDQRTAIAALRAMFRDPLLGNLRLRWEVERALLEDLATLADPPVDFCLAAISAFAWDQDPRHLVPEVRAVAERLRALVEADRRVAGLRRRARLWALRMWIDRTALAAALLTGVYRPMLFRIARADPRTVRAVKSLLKDIHAHSGGTAARKLDKRVIAWWDEAVGLEPAPPARSERAA